MAISALNQGLISLSDSSTGIVMLSLGNMGFSTTTCFSDYIQLDLNRSMGCRSGSMTNLTFYGIIPEITDWESDSKKTED